MQDELKDSNTADPYEDVTGIILAGGMSSRYGKNKALDTVAGIPLIERVIGVMQSLFRHLILITNMPEHYAYLKLPMKEDLIKGLGPLGGIYTALSTISNDAGFVVACDMPFLNRELIRYMVNAGMGYDAVVPRISGKTEALHSLYSKRCLPAIRKLIEAEEFQVFRFFPTVSVRYVGESEIDPLDPDHRSFFNINRPNDLVLYQRILKEVM